MSPKICAPVVFAAAIALGCSSQPKADPVGPAGNNNGGGDHTAAPANPSVNGPFEKQIETFHLQGEPRPIPNSKATLVTTEIGAYVSFKTTELTPGHVYTLWWVIMNDPSKCSKSPCSGEEVLGQPDVVKSEVTWADGIVAPESGEALLSGFLAKGDVWKPWFGNGFTNPLGAEIHLILNDHGPLIPKMASMMLSSYRTGCSDDSLPPPFPDTAKADGKAGPNKCALVQDVIFQQKR